MNTFLKFLLIVSLIAPNIAFAKPCGDGYIRDDYECHQDGGGESEMSSSETALLIGGVFVGLVVLFVVFNSASKSHHASTTHNPNAQRSDSFESFVQDLGGTVTK